MELAGKEVAFEATAAGAVKWRVVDHAEVAQHAKGAPLWCFARAASVLWLHRVFASQTPSAGQCDACLQPSTCSATRKTLCMDALRLPPSPTFTCLQFVNSSPPLAPRCRREQLLCQAQAAARGHPALERQVDGGHGRLCQRGECSHSCVVPPLLSPACCGYLLRHGWLSSHMVRGSSRCICVIGLLPAANRRSIAACLLMWELRVSAAHSAAPFSRAPCNAMPRARTWHAAILRLTCLPPCSLPQVVGAKSKNLAGLRGKLPSWINLPSSVTVRRAQIMRATGNQLNSREALRHRRWLRRAIGSLCSRPVVWLVTNCRCPSPRLRRCCSGARTSR